MGVLMISACGESTTTTSTPPKETTPTFENKAHRLVYEMTEKIGTYSDLLAQKDVVYTYTYQTPDGKKDISTEKYIFDGELSYGGYDTHERTLPDLEGSIEQGYDGDSFWLKNNGKTITNEEALKRVKFNRKTNFYWFAMYQKLLDPGVNYEYIKSETIDKQTYDVVKISFDSEDGKPTDIYQLYINQATQLVDQFLFTVADFNVMETPFLMKMEYEKVDEIYIPTKRKYTKATWEGKPLNDTWTLVNWSDIKFNNGLTKATFEQ